MPATSFRLYDFFPEKARLVVISLVVFMAISSYRLDSGLRLALWPRAGAGTVSISTWIGAGSASDPDSLPGLAHFFEHMLFKGTERRGVGDVARELESVGGDINAWTTFDNVVVQLRVPPNELDLGFDVASDMIGGSTFPQQELELERDVVLDELDQGRADPTRALGRLVFSNVFRRHPYRRSILGTEASIGRIGQRDLAQFSRSHINASNMLVSIAGDFDPADVHRAAAASRFAHLASGSRQRRDRPLPTQRRARAQIKSADIAESQLILAFPSPPLGTRDHLLLDMVSIALGQGGSSSLARELEEREIATSTGAYVHGFRDAGLFIASASCDPAGTETCAARLTEQVFAARDELLGEAELEKVKNAIVGDSVYGRETVAGLAAAMGSSWAHTGDPNGDHEQLAWAREVTAGELQELARKHLKPEKATMVAMVPDDAKAPSAGAFGRMLSRVSKAVPSSPKPKPKSTSVSRATQKLVLPSGVTLVVHRDDTVPLVAAQATWRGGLRLENIHNAGIGALLARTITRGCGTLTDNELAATLDRRAATLVGFSGRDSFGVRAEWIADRQFTGLKLLLDCIESPTFDTAIVERERRALATEAESRENSPGHLAHQMFATAVFGSDPYGLDGGGTISSLETLAGRGAEEIESHYSVNYPPNHATIAIVGDVDPDAVIAFVNARLGSLPTATPAAQSSKSMPASKPGPQERYAHLEKARAHLVVGFPGASLSEPDRHALSVISAILAGQGGRLFTSLREERGLVYRIAAHSIVGASPGAIAVVTSCAPTNVDAALREIRKEIDRLRDEDVSASEISRAVTFLAGATTNSLERRGALAAALAYAEAQGQGFQSVFQTRQTLSKVGVADIRRVARKFLRWDRAVTSTVTPPAASPEVIRRASGSKRRLPAAAARKRPAP